MKDKKILIRNMVVEAYTLKLTYTDGPAINAH